MYIAAAAVAATYAAHESPTVLGFMALLFLWMAWKREGAAVFCVVILAAVSLFFLQQHREPPPHPMSGNYSGSLSFEQGAKMDGDRLRGFALLDGRVKVYANYRMKDAGEKEAIAAVLPEAVFRTAGTFEAPGPAAHEFAFDMGRFIERNGASSLLAVSSLELSERQSSLAVRLAKQRAALSRHIRGTFPESLAAEAEALLIGERELMTGEQERTYQTLGITHLFAISGLHVSIASGLLYFLLVRLHVRKESALAVMIIVLPLYAMLVGGAPSVWRAVGMAVAVFSCRLLKIRLPIAQILIACFILSIVLDPYAMYNIGFQLSYGATFGIIYSLKFLSASLSVLKTGFLITFISQMTLYPILLFHFYEISLSAFVVNSVFVPLYTVIILPANFIMLALTAGPAVFSDLVFSLYEPLRLKLEGLMEWLASWPYQLWNPGKPEGWAVFLLMASVVVFYCLAEKRFRLRQLSVIVVPAVAMSLLPYADSGLKVAFLDVGQGDSAIIELPNRKGVYVIDTGGVLRFEGEAFQERRNIYEVGRQVVAPYLKGRGISHIDKLILTHPDADHAEGADEILEEFRVGEMHVTPGSMSAAIMQELAPYADGVDVFYPGKGSGWSEGDAHFLYLAPDDHDYEGNNDSLVLLMQSGRFRVLFTGDLEEQGEKDILELYPEALADITVLKVGHHGSKTSSGEAFLTALSPAISIFSTGRDNRYGHPSEEVVSRFRELGLPTLNTAEDGTVEFTYNKGKLHMTTSR